MSAEPATEGTAFAPAARLPAPAIARQRELFQNDRLTADVLNAVPNIFLILNEQRQIVYANRSLLEQFGIAKERCVEGMRPGELLNCIHSAEREAGCGTAEACSMCGAVRAILASQGGERQVAECRLLRNDGVEALDLRVYATPLDLAGQRFSMVAVVDISNEKRRRILERIFFHDLLNTAGGLIGFTELLRNASADEVESFRQTVVQLAGRLVDEIRAQQQLASAESGELVPEWQPVQTGAMLRDLEASFRRHEAADGKHFVRAAHPSMVEIVTDPTLLRRVLINMTKNAFEASRPGQTVTVDCQVDETSVTFSVHNEAPVPREVQLQLFQRSFSTKSNTRGLGSYSMKLISERYLQGKVWFTTGDRSGTTFYARYPLHPA